MGWYSYFIGYLVVIIEGQFPEKVINMALTRGIFLWDIRQIGEGKILLKVRLPGFKPLRHLIRDSGCRMKIYQRRGFPFRAKKIRNRQGLILGSILFFLTLYVLSSFIWFIEVTGVEDLTVEEVKEMALKQGLKKGVLIKNITIDEIEEKMKEENPKLAWVGIEIRGTKVTIKVAEKILLPETEDNLAGHLIARKSGVIEEMLVLLGTPLVKEGEVVEKGQILIAGLIYPQLELQDDGTYIAAGEPEQVKARGVVRARVNHRINSPWPIQEVKKKLTGKIEKQILLKVQDKYLVIRGPEKTSYQYFQKKSQSKEIFRGRIPHISIEIITNTYSEVYREEKIYGYEGAYYEAVRKGEEALLKIISRDSKILDKKINIIDPRVEDMVEVELIWECIENIAEQQKLATGSE